MNTAAHSESALIIFAKAPIPGQVKTRLCPPLTPDEAATLHGSFVLDMLERSRDAIRSERQLVDRFVACTPSPEHAFFKVIEARHGVRLLAQLGEDLGQRMHRAFEATFSHGYRRALLIGTDLPLMPGSYLGEALTRLSDHDVVLGPAVDGGYYLVGLTHPTAELFTGSPWSTDQVWSLTLKKAESLGLRTTLLPTCRDVDRLEDLHAIIQECGLADAKGGRDNPLLSKRTTGVLRTLATRLQARETSKPADRTGAHP